jgi:hypothetical protein
MVQGRVASHPYDPGKMISQLLSQGYALVMRNQQYTVCGVKAIPYLTNEKYP